MRSFFFDAAVYLFPQGAVGPQGDTGPAGPPGQAVSCSFAPLFFIRLLLSSCPVVRSDTNRLSGPSHGLDSLFDHVVKVCMNCFTLPMCM